MGQADPASEISCNLNISKDSGNIQQIIFIIKIGCNTGVELTAKKNTHCDTQQDKTGKDVLNTA
jgi:hypothetical protein